MNFILRMILSAVAVFILAEMLPGVSVNSYVQALLTALILAVFNVFIKPFLVVLTLPITVLTLGLFLLVINAVIILLADYVLDGFNVDGWLWALIFSVLLSIFQSVLYSILKKDKS